jgi:hypothetical protein
MRAVKRLWVCLLLALPAALAPVDHAAASADPDVPEPLVEAVHRALDEWSRFATTRDLALVGGSFVVDGPQWGQFMTEAGVGEGSPSAEPLRFEVRRLRVRSLETTTATVWAEVAARRDGFESEIFGWDFDLILRDGQWRVWTIVAADEPTASVEIQPAGAETATTNSPAAQVFDSQPRSFDEGTATAAAVTAKGTRLPALSAWVVVVTLVGVAVAGYMAPRIDRRGEG